MRSIFLLAALVAACAATHPTYPYDPDPSPPVVTPTSTPAPGPAPTATPLPPYPLSLRFTAAFLAYAELCRLVEAAAGRWNDALGEPVLVVGGAGRPITVDLMDEDRLTHAVGAVDSLTAPHWAHLWPGIEAPTDRAVALHELGHLLGCTHSADYQDVMYYRNGWATDLSPADIQQARQAIQARRASS